MIKILLFSWNKIKYPTHHNQIFSEQYNWKLTTGKTYFTFTMTMAWFSHVFRRQISQIHERDN